MRDVVSHGCPPLTPAPSSTLAVLIDVQCGRIVVEGKTMKPDDRKGKLRVCKGHGRPQPPAVGRSRPRHALPARGRLHHLPQEAEMKFIPKPGVFVIKFPDDPSRNMFFWSRNRPGRSRTTSSPPASAPALNDNRPSRARSRSPPRLAQPPFDRPRRRRPAPWPPLGREPFPTKPPAPTASVAATPAAPAKAEAPPAPPRPRFSSSALQAALGNLGAPRGASPSGAQGAPAGGIDHAAMAAMLAGMQARGWAGARAAPG